MKPGLSRVKNKNWAAYSGILPDFECPRLLKKLTGTVWSWSVVLSDDGRVTCGSWSCKALQVYLPLGGRTHAWSNEEAWIMNSRKVFVSK